MTFGPLSVPLLVYFGVSFAWSWGWWLSMAAAGLHTTPGMLPSHLPGLLGPALGAMAAGLVPGWPGRAAVAHTLLGRRWHRLGLVATLSPALLLLVLLPGPGWVDLAGLVRYPGLPALGLLPVFLAALLLNGVGEEAGWRGFLQPRLQARFGPWRGLFVLWLVWAIWHAPLFLVVESFRTMGWPLFALGWLPGLLAGTLVLAHVRRLTGGGVLGVALWHTLYNFASATPAGPALPAVATMLTLVWAAVLLWRRQAGDVVATA